MKCQIITDYLRVNCNIILLIADSASIALYTRLEV